MSYESVRRCDLGCVSRPTPSWDALLREGMLRVMEVRAEVRAERRTVAWHVTVWDSQTEPRRLRFATEAEAWECSARAEAAGFAVATERVAVCK